MVAKSKQIFDKEQVHILVFIVLKLLHFLNKYFLQIYFVIVLLKQYNIYFYSFLNFYTFLNNLYYFFTITTIQYTFTYLYTQLNTFFTLLLTQNFYFFYSLIYTTLLHQYVIFIYFNSCKNFFSEQLLKINNKIIIFNQFSVAFDKRNLQDLPNNKRPSHVKIVYRTLLNKNKSDI